MPKVNNSYTQEQDKNRQILATITYYQTIKNVSDARLASIAGFTTRTLSNRRNHPDMFSIQELRRISNVLKIPAEELIKGI